MQNIWQQKQQKKYSLPVNNNIIITTQFPCWDCAKLIVKNKLSKVFTYKRPLKGPWWDDKPVLELFKNNKLEICYDQFYCTFFYNRKG